MSTTEPGGIGLAGSIVAAGYYAIWLADMTARIAAFCDESGMELPFPEQLREFPITLALAMEKKCNEIMPDGVNFRLAIIAERRRHKHLDRHGAEISCQTAHYYHSRDDYGKVADWENDAGNVRVHTMWIGDEDCVFETRVFSTDPTLDGKTMDYMTEAEAKVGHDAMCSLIRFIQSS